MRRSLGISVGAAACALALGAGAVSAQEDSLPPSDDGPPSTLPLVVVPSGCVVPDPPDVVFVGRLEDSDFRTGRFEVLQVRAGDISPFAVEGLVDVRFGLDAQYLEAGGEYIVSARRDPVLGVLASQIREPTPSFGGDDVIGVSESDVECPTFDDPIRTVMPDGRPVDSGVLTPLFEDKSKLVGAFAIPLGIGAAVIFVLAMLRVSITGVAHGVSNAVQDHKRPRG